MSTDKISIFNYEAFYLDYLEGNLGEEDTALLLAFLEEHPELVEDEDYLVVLDPKNDTPVFEDKDSLKVSSAAAVGGVNDEATITLSNAEHFLIAESEGQLSAAKQQELNALVAQHPQLEKERAYLAAVFLKADQSMVYADKSGLKRKGAVVFWPYIALAAASVLIAFFFVMNNGSEQPQIADENSNDKKIEQIKDESPIIENEQPQIADNVESDNQSVEQSDDRMIGPSKNPTIQRSNNLTIQQSEIAVNSIKHKQVPRRVLNSMDDKNLQPVSAQIDPVHAVTTPENEYAQVVNAQMKNPIKPITTRLEKTLNTDVDFQTGKAANNSGAGFLLKIGKFELSRKKGKK